MPHRYSLLSGSGLIIIQSKICLCRVRGCFVQLINNPAEGMLGKIVTRGPFEDVAELALKRTIAQRRKDYSINITMNTRR
jgi:hypothetical protein